MSAQTKNATTDNFMTLYKPVSEAEGWLLPEAAAIWDCLYSFQSEKGIAGHHLEIGVWRGKTAAIMTHYADPKNERIVLIDIDIQKDKIEPTLKKIRSDLKHVRFIETPSGAFRHNTAIDDMARKCRWIHIDGKHTGDAVYNDLEIADKFLSADGLLCVDDFFDFQYPQVTAGLFKYLQLHPYSFRLFLCGYKKAYLARPESVFHYLGYCERMADEMSTRGMEVTLSKSTYASDLDCFSLVPRYNNWKIRGTDWDKDEVEISRRITGQKW